MRFSRKSFKIILKLINDIPRSIGLFDLLVNNETVNKDYCLHFMYHLSKFRNTLDKYYIFIKSILKELPKVKLDLFFYLVNIAI